MGWFLARFSRVHRQIQQRLLRGHQVVHALLRQLPQQPWRRLPARFLLLARALPHLLHLLDRQIQQLLLRVHVLLRAVPRQLRQHLHRLARRLRAPLGLLDRFAHFLRRQIQKLLLALDEAFHSAPCQLRHALPGLQLFAFAICFRHRMRLFRGGIQHLFLHSDQRLRAVSRHIRHHTRGHR